MSINNFKATIWTAKLLANLRNAHVYLNALNRDYEGDIKNVGDTVKISSLGPITVDTYTPHSNINIQALEGATQTLVVDQVKYYAFKVDDVEKAQMAVNALAGGMEEAAWTLAETADDWCAALLAAGVDAGNKLAALTGVGIGASDDDAYKALVDLGVRLDENNVPEGNRWCVVPPWFDGILRQDPRFVSFGTPENLTRLRGKAVGAAAGFSVWKSNNVPVAGSAFTILAGYKGAATYANQLTKTEAFRPENLFSDAVKGLHLYGAKVTRPYGLASVVCTAA